MDAPTTALIETIGDLGYSVSFTTSNGRHIVEAVELSSGGTFVVRSEDLYQGVVELADGWGVNTLHVSRVLPVVL